MMRSLLSHRFLVQPNLLPKLSLRVLKLFLMAALNRFVLFGLTF
jgi:hypothetical protein